MNQTNPQVDRYLKETKKWREEIKQLRPILLACGLTEELKWDKPCYTFQNANIAIIIGFKETCSLVFCKGVLLKDPRKILVKFGENNQAGRKIPFTDARQIKKLEPILKTYLQEAIQVEKAGLKVNYKKTSDFPIPEELQNKLDAIPALKKAFAALTPGRQRGYLLYFSAAKQSKTRSSRVEKCLQPILHGKGLHD
jgi:uncharacterized protein YdeI (YjbR/CyaY-like superfamily)